MRQYASPASIMTNEEMIYYLMDEDEAANEMAKSVKEINEVLGLPSTTMVRLILNYFNWDKNTLTERFYDDPDKLFRTLNIVNPNLSPSLDCNPLSPPSQIQHDPLLLVAQQTSDNAIVTCKTCYLEKPLKEFYSLACRHEHCLDCWRMYLELKIVHDGCGKPIACPSRCNQIVDDEQILKLCANNDQLRKRYRQLLVETFVDTNRLTHWCPGIGCRTIVKIKSYVPNCAQMITCDECQTIFCFSCSKQWHDPVQCSLLHKWEKKNRDDSMTGEWVIANTKECPKCHTNIEKNGGCNHMTCRKQGCAHEFCWLCFGTWKDHASQQCNVYRDSEVTKNQETACESLKRYMHYYTRYHTHHQSLEFEGKLLEKVQQRIAEMQAESMSFGEQQALHKAFNVLQQCRRTLKYTYAFAYYLYRNNQAEVFEQNQADLEQATEALSGFMEQEIEAQPNLSQKLMDKTRYCDHRRKILLDHCKEGYSEHYWGGLDSY